MILGGVDSYPLLSQAPTPVEVELGCDNKNITAKQALISVLCRFRMKLAVSDFGNLRALSHKISAAHKAGKGKWLYMRENLEGVDKSANVGLLLLAS